MWWFFSLRFAFARSLLILAMAAVATRAQVESRDKNVQWYISELKELEQPAREVFEKYSGIPSEKVVPHILEVVSLTLHAPTQCQGANVPSCESERTCLADLALSLHWTFQVSRFEHQQIAKISRSSEAYERRG